MRFKHFEGKTLSAARAQVRRALGDDAMITATHDLGKEGYRIVCALEPRVSSKDTVAVRHALPPRQIADLSRALAWHQFPFEIVEEILDSLTHQRKRASNEEALAAALKDKFAFESLESLWDKNRAILFFGPPGAGKTASCVKLAWLARLAQRSASLISTDSLRTGGAEQLEMYAEKIGCRFFHSRSVQRFERLLRTIDSKSLLFIDAPGINPYAKEELSHLQSLTALNELLPVLVLPTWIDIQAGIDLVGAFRVANCRHIILTCEDIDRRLGRSVAIARAAALKLTYISPRPHIAQGLELLDAKSLALRCLKDIPSSFLTTTRATAQTHPPQAQTPSSIEIESTTNLQNSHSQKPIANNVAVATEATRGVAAGATKKVTPMVTSRVISRVTPAVTNAPQPYRIAVASGKGGVGKTAITIALAHNLARLGNRTLLFDADLGLANIDIQLGLQPEHDLTQALRGTCSLQDCVARAPQGGFDAIVGKSGAASFADLAPHTLQKLLADLQEVGTAYQTLLLDLGAGIDRTVRLLTLVADEILIVITDEPTSLTDAYALIKVTLRRKPEARISVVVNMAETERRGEQAFDSLQRTCRNFLRYEPRLAGIVRRDGQVVEAIRKREPLMIYAPDSDAARDIARLARVFPTPA